MKFTLLDRIVTTRTFILDRIDWNFNNLPKFHNLFDKDSNPNSDITAV